MAFAPYAKLPFGMFYYVVTWHGACDRAYHQCIDMIASTSDNTIEHK